MDLSVVLFTSDRGITPADAARAAEEAGFHAFYVPEHSHIPTSRDSNHPGTGGELPDDRYLRILDPWVALATAAAVTSTIRLGTAVALPMEHDPITLAKTLATLDHLSGGRVTLGRRVRLERRGARGPRRTRQEAAHRPARVPRADAAALGQRGRVLRGRVRSSQAQLGLPQAGAAAADPDPRRCRGYAEELRLDRRERRRVDHHADRDRHRGPGRGAQRVLGGGRPRGGSADRRTPHQQARTRPARAVGGSRGRRGDVRTARQERRRGRRPSSAGSAPR